MTKVDWNGRRLSSRPTESEHPGVEINLHILKKQQSIWKLLDKNRSLIKTTPYTCKELFLIQA